MYNADKFERSVNVDFSKRIRADVICTFVGDFHQDAVEEYYGIKYILTANSVTYYTERAEQELRADGDKTELLFDIVTINKKNRKRYITRVGVGQDHEVDY